MSISTRIIRYVPLALIVAAVAAPGARAASGSQSSEAAFKAAHWKHEDSVDAASRGASVRSLPAWLDAHWKHEDRLYDARTDSPSQLQSAAPAVESGGSIDRLAVLTATGGVAALIVLGTVAATGVRRRHRVAQS